MASGWHSLEIACWRPMGSWFDRFIGANSELQYPDIAASSLSKYGLRTMSGCIVTVEINIIGRNFHLHGVLRWWYWYHTYNISIRSLKLSYLRQVFSGSEVVFINWHFVYLDSVVLKKWLRLLSSGRWDGIRIVLVFVSRRKEWAVALLIVVPFVCFNSEILSRTGDLLKFTHLVTIINRLSPCLDNQLFNKMVNLLQIIIISCLIVHSFDVRKLLAAVNTAIEEAQRVFTAHCLIIRWG